MNARLGAWASSGGADSVAKGGQAGKKETGTEAKSDGGEDRVNGHDPATLLEVGHHCNTVVMHSESVTSPSPVNTGAGALAASWPHGQEPTAASLIERSELITGERARALAGARAGPKKDLACDCEEYSCTCRKQMLSPVFCWVMVRSFRI